MEFIVSKGAQDLDTHGGVDRLVASCPRAENFENAMDNIDGSERSPKVPPAGIEDWTSNGKSNGTCSALPHGSGSATCEKESKQLALSKDACMSMLHPATDRIQGGLG